MFQLEEIKLYIVVTCLCVTDIKRQTHKIDYAHFQCRVFLFTNVKAYEWGEKRAKHLALFRV